MFFTHRGELSEFRRRYRWMRLFVVLTFLVLIGRLVQLQVFQGSALNEQSLANVIRKVPVPSIRGRIFDSKGRVVATNTPSYSVFAIPHYFDVGIGLERLGAILGYDEERKRLVKVKIAEMLANPKDVRRFQQVAIAEGITPEQVSAIKAYQDELPGVDVVDIPARYYPYGSLASHLVGYMNEVNRSDVEKHRGVVEDDYRSGDRIGRTGVERAMEFDLRGVRGWQKKMVDARGLPLPTSRLRELLPEPKPLPAARKHSP